MNFVKKKHQNLLKEVLEQTIVIKGNLEIAG
jgi:hypothetical protein